MSIFRALGFLFLAAATVLIVPAAEAAKPSKSRAPKAEAVEVEFFEAMKAGDIEVKVIAKDSTTGNVLITNKAAKPLSIKLPEAFAAVPVAAQFGGGMGGMGGGMGGMGGGMGGMGGGMGGQQAMGGGMMGGMGGGGMGGMGGGGMGGMGGGGGGFFKVEPAKVAKLKIVTVCLEHGKAEPNPRTQYVLKPIEAYTSNAATIETVKMLARGEIDQHSAQAATWNSENGLTWQQLAAKIGRKHLDGRTEPYFTGQHLQRALQISREADRRAEDAQNTTQTVLKTSASGNSQQ